MASPSTHGNGPVLVTGASGYLAGWIIVALLQRGYRVRGTLRSPSKETATRAALREQVAAAADASLLAFVIVNLTEDAGWDAAVSGCDCVLHVASDMGSPGSKLAGLIPVARDGTLRVVRAALKARVRRIVITSSCRTLFGSSLKNGNLDESSWADASDAAIGAYPQSKVIAERAAWDELQAHGNGVTTLTAVLPSLIQGPILGSEVPHSVAMSYRMLSGQVPAVPNMRVQLVDVRDAAELHVLAMASPAAAGQRYIATNELLWLTEVAQCLKTELPAEAAKVSTRTVPDWVIRIAAWFSNEAAFVAKTLGKDIRYDSTKARTELNWKPRPARDSLVDTARSLIKAGVINN